MTKARKELVKSYLTDGQVKHALSMKFIHSRWLVYILIKPYYLTNLKLSNRFILFCVHYHFRLVDMYLVIFIKKGNLLKRLFRNKTCDRYFFW